MTRSAFVTLLLVLAFGSEGVLAQKPSAKELAKNLRSRDAAVRLEAATELAALGPAAAPAAAALYRALDDASPAIRKAAAKALGAIGPKAVPMVRKGLHDRKRQLEALAAAGALGDAAGPLMPDILKLWRQETVEMQRGIESAVKLIGGPALPYLRKSLADRHDAAYAAQALGQLGPAAAPAVPELIALLRRRGDLGQPYAATALGQIRDARAVPALGEAVAGGVGADDHLESIAVNALGSLRMIGPDSEPAVPMITNALNSAKSPTLRARAAMTLGRIGTSEPAALDALRNAARSPDKSVAKEANAALEILTPPPEASAATLVRGLGHPKEAIRMRALDALAALPRISADLTPVLMKRIEGDPSTEVRIKSMVLLGRIGKEADQALPALEQLAKAEDKELAEAARDAIARISGKAR